MINYGCGKLTITFILVCSAKLFSKVVILISNILIGLFGAQTFDSLFFTEYSHRCIF